MKKIVPDPPAPSSRGLTVHTRFASCRSDHPPLFAVCGGAEFDKAMVHLIVMLRSAYETNLQACDTVKDNYLAGMLWATQHTLEASMALAESMMKGMEEGQAMG
ncbi:hypothetical protein V0R50_28095 [Pseudomonas sp. 148P]|uniref:DUF3077 domain-containing protein n=1 Tax=Pseudomonas ulcerans TaxID=3115852 RepID=A0ABU7HZX1_9PSED|nr:MULTISPECIES: hypothetical protein [unclassified Pseudomonas]MEE1921795.1 hypothetical protein [Pseudomonas sp. 147P]MEE1937104.1 hypothetical protein [Pseudomonas sp. 148P]